MSSLGSCSADHRRFVFCGTVSASTKTGVIQSGSKPTVELAAGPSSASPIPQEDEGPRTGRSLACLYQETTKHL